MVCKILRFYSATYDAAEEPSCLGCLIGLDYAPSPASIQFKVIDKEPLPVVVDAPARYSVF
ncbi:hypothetical protein O9993_10600 [Vibrio lentus]|nr:hypothetical protein [Vibrio lentus]